MPVRSRTGVWRVPCTACGGTFCLFEGSRLPLATDRIDWRRIRNLAGQPVAPFWRPLCCTCEALLTAAPPLDWQRRLD